MNNGILLFTLLPTEYVDWIMLNAEILQYQQDETIIKQNDKGGNVFILLKGSLRVSASFFENDYDIAVLGPGDIIGEISLFGEITAIATVAAAEESSLLSLSYEKIAKKCKEDVDFAGVFNQALNYVLGKKLHKANMTLIENILLENSDVHDLDNIFDQRTNQFTMKLNNCIRDFEKVAQSAFSKNKDVLINNIYKILDGIFNENNELVKSMYQEKNLLKERGCNKLLQDIMLPYLLLSPFAERCLTKPRGFAGDYQTIDLIYNNQPGGTSTIGKYFDSYFLSLAAVKSVRLRKEFLTNKIIELVKEKKSRLYLASIASGTSNEILDCYENDISKEDLSSSLFLVDKKANSVVSQYLVEKGLQDNCNVIPTNIIHLLTLRLPKETHEFDIVSACGVFEKLDDSLAEKLIIYLIELLRPGGVLLLDHMSENINNYILWNLLFDWELIGRDEESLLNLFAADKRADANVHKLDQGKMRYIVQYKKPD